MLTQIPVLDTEECDRLSRDVCDLRSQWIPRTPDPASFFTLGVAAYQDLAPVEFGPRQDYCRQAPLLNVLILDRFGWLLQRVQKALDEFLGTTTRFSSRLALPGFHIFEYFAIPRGGDASVHFDLQYQLIDWDDAEPAPDLSDPISFTLAIKLPKGGGGINEWDLTYEQTIRGPLQDLAALASGTLPTYHAYSLGAIAIHSGHRLHQIAGVTDVQPGDQRITLQGHGVRRGDATVLYW